MYSNWKFNSFIIKKDLSLRVDSRDFVHTDPEILENAALFAW